MSEIAEKLKAALLELPLEEQLEIADFLYANLPASPDALSEDDTDFDATLQRRADELASGKVKGVPAEEVLERLRKKYAK